MFYYSCYCELKTSHSLVGRYVFRERDSVKVCQKGQKSPLSRGQFLLTQRTFTRAGMGKLWPLGQLCPSGVY